VTGHLQNGNEMTAATQIRLANDIAAQFHHLPPDQAAAAVANHFRMFWDPRMRRQLLDVIERSPDDGLDPIAIAAAKLLTR
jgi:formate dehydrogenase subunit delta